MGAGVSALAPPNEKAGLSSLGASAFAPPKEKAGLSAGLSADLSSAGFPNANPLGFSLLLSLDAAPKPDASPRPDDGASDAGLPNEKPLGLAPSAGFAPKPAARPRPLGLGASVALAPKKLGTGPSFFFVEVDSLCDVGGVAKNDEPPLGFGAGAASAGLGAPNEKLGAGASLAPNSVAPGAGALAGVVLGSAGPPRRLSSELSPDAGLEKVNVGAGASVLGCSAGGAGAGAALGLVSDLPSPNVKWLGKSPVGSLIFSSSSDCGKSSSSSSSNAVMRPDGACRRFFFGAPWRSTERFRSGSSSVRTEKVSLRAGGAGAWSAVGSSSILGAHASARAAAGAGGTGTSASGSSTVGTSRGLDVGLRGLVGLAALAARRAERRTGTSGSGSGATSSSSRIAPSSAPLSASLGAPPRMACSTSSSSCSGSNASSTRTEWRSLERMLGCCAICVRRSCCERCRLRECGAILRPGERDCDALSVPVRCVGAGSGTEIDVVCHDGIDCDRTMPSRRASPSGVRMLSSARRMRSASFCGGGGRGRLRSSSSASTKPIAGSQTMRRLRADGCSAGASVASAFASGRGGDRLPSTELSDVVRDAGGSGADGRTGSGASVRFGSHSRTDGCVESDGVCVGPRCSVLHAERDELSPLIEWLAGNVSTPRAPRARTGVSWARVRSALGVAARAKSAWRSGVYCGVGSVDRGTSNEVRADLSEARSGVYVGGASILARLGGVGPSCVGSRPRRGLDQGTARSNRLPMLERSPPLCGVCGSDSFWVCDPLASHIELSDVGARDGVERNITEAASDVRPSGAEKSRAGPSAPTWFDDDLL